MLYEYQIDNSISFHSDSLKFKKKLVKLLGNIQKIKGKQSPTSKSFSFRKELLICKNILTTRIVNPQKHVPEYPDVILHFSEHRFCPLSCLWESAPSISLCVESDLHWQAITKFF